MTITSPKSVDGASVTPNNRGSNKCLCSPTTHQGSFRCRFHRSKSSTWIMKRSNSMPVTRSISNINANTDTDHRICNTNDNIVSIDITSANNTLMPK